MNQRHCEEKWNDSTCVRVVICQARAEAGLAHPDNLSVLRDTQGIWINRLVEEGLSNLMLHYLF